MALSPKLVPFDEDYKFKCFEAWYFAGCPGARVAQGVLPTSPDGRKPSVATIQNWMDAYQWSMKARDYDARAMVKVSEAIVNTKAELLQIQLKGAKSLAEKALSHLLEHPLDNMSAVQTYFRATAEQRTVMGLSELMQRIGNMTDEELQKEIAKRAERLGIEDAIPVEEENIQEGKDKDAG